LIVLDTHAWVWWVSSSRQLPAPVRARIDDSAATGQVYVSSISAWEVALLVRRGRLELTMAVEDWIARSEALPFLHFVPVDNRIALRSASQPDALPRDPADRMIVATALSLRAPVVTCDEKIRQWPQLATIWAT
jgi:PIN domain nuclease of toxin-antitoxin system